MPQWDIAVGGGDEWTNWYEQCDDITAPTDDTVVSDGLYATDICISVYDLSILEADSDSDYEATSSLGWYCDESKQQYFMGLFKDADCTVLDDNDYGSDAIIGYTNDACLPIDVALWTSVKCGYYNGESDTTITTTADNMSNEVTPEGNGDISMFHGHFIGLFIFMMVMFIWN